MEYTHEQHGGMHKPSTKYMDYSANLNPFGMPETVREAARQGVLDATYYPDPECVEIRQAIAAYENKHINDTVDTRIMLEDVVVGNGAAELIFHICQAQKPRKALLLTPTFTEYELALQSVGCNCQYYEVTEATAFQIQEKQVTELLETLQPDMDIFFICNPNNPTGQKLSMSVLRQLAAKCEKNNILMVVDACFLDFCGRTRDMEQCMLLPVEYRQVLVLKAFTKLYAMPGLRLGYGISKNRKLLTQLYRVRQPWNVSTPAQYAGIAALQEDDYVKESVACITQERQILYQIIKLQGLSEWVAEPTANYLFFRADTRLGEALQRKGFLIRDCSNFRGLQVGYYRIAVRKKEENELLIKAWKECIQEWQK